MIVLGVAENVRGVVMRSCGLGIAVGFKGKNKGGVDELRAMGCFGAVSLGKS